MDPSQPRRSNLKWLITILVIVIIGAALYYYFGIFRTAGNKISNVISPTSLTTIKTSPSVKNSVSPSVSTSIPADWKIYTNSQYAFTIRYPKTVSDIKYPTSINSTEEWTTKEFEANGGISGVAFGPVSSASGGYIWAINILNGPSTTIDNEIDKQGKQFTDRVVTKKSVQFNGIGGSFVTVTTPSMPEWVSKSIYFEKNGKIYIIGNGAIESNSFDIFYKTFKFTR